MSEKRVLIVDDEPDFADLVDERLKKAGYATEVAFSGEEALEKIHANPPDLVVLDVMMPGMSGYDVCTELKQDEKYQNIPIVLLTAVASQVPSTRYSHYNGMTMEADDYIPKPAPPDRIEDAVRRLL